LALLARGGLALLAVVALAVVPSACGTSHGGQGHTTTTRAPGY